MVKMSEEEWKEYLRKTGTKDADYKPDRVDPEGENARRKKAHEEIDRDVETVRDRQSAEYWNEKNAAKKAEQKKERERAQEKERSRGKLIKKIVHTAREAVNATQQPGRRRSHAPHRAPARRAPARQQPAAADPFAYGIDFSTYSDPFAGVSPRSGGSIFNGKAPEYRDPFAGAGFRAGTPGRGGSMDMHGSVFSGDTRLFPGMFKAPRAAPRRTAPKKKKARR